MSQGLPKLYKRLLFDRNGWKEVRRSGIQALKLQNSDLFDYGSMELGVILEEVRRSSIQALKLHNSDVFDYGSMESGVIYIDSTTQPRIQDFYLNNTVTRLL